MKTVFAHINNTNKLDSIKGLCAKLNIRIEPVGNKDLGRPILNQKSVVKDWFFVYNIINK